MDKEKLELECKFGTLECTASEEDEHVEFFIDLVRPDGRKYQVCCVGTNEGNPFLPDWYTEEQKEYAVRESESIHVYLWDGKSEDCEDEYLMDPNGDGYWTKED